MWRVYINLTEFRQVSCMPHWWRTEVRHCYFAVQLVDVNYISYTVGFGGSGWEAYTPLMRHVKFMSRQGTSASRSGSIIWVVE